MGLRGSQDFLDSSGKTRRNIDEWDDIVGIKVRLRLGDGNWLVPYYANIGAGSSNWTWQPLLDLGYELGWGDASLSIRSLSYDFNDKDEADLRMTDPTGGVDFR